MIFDKLKKVKAFVFDVDGVMTDGRVLVHEDGQQLRTFHTRDGYALQLAVKRGYPICVITGGHSSSVIERMDYLGISDVFLGVKDKSKVLDKWLKKNGLSLDDVLYMGDDIPDLKDMSRVGVAACPANAVEEIRAVSAYISPMEGGRGAVRDVIEKVMKLQECWGDDPHIAAM